MELYEVISGQVAANVRYQVVGGTSITYNSIVYVAGSFFVGVAGITTYTKTAGTEIVTFASYIAGVSTAIKNDFYTALYNDSSMLFGLSIALKGNSPQKSQIIRTQRK